MKKLIQENLNFQNLKNEQSKDKNTNTNDDKGEKVSNNSSLIRNSSKGKNNITNKSIDFITKNVLLISVVKVIMMKN